MKETSSILWQDTQHQQLFVLIDMIKSSPHDVSVFSRLQDYANNHFYLEEQYMKKLDYPEIEAHIIAHNKFRSELKAMVRDQDHYDQNSRNALSLFLEEWLSRHIFGIDKKLERYIIESNIK